MPRNGDVPYTHANVTLARKDFAYKPTTGDVIQGVSAQEYEFGWLSWFDGVHTVRSPMVVSSA